MRNHLSILALVAALLLAAPVLAAETGDAPASPPADAAAPAPEPAAPAAEPAAPPPAAAAPATPVSLPGACSLKDGQYGAGTVFTTPNSCDESGYCTIQTCWHGAWYKRTLGCNQKAQTCPAFAPS